MATINSNLFGSEQKKQLRSLGCDENTQIKIMCTTYFGSKHVIINGKSHIIK